MVHDKQEYRLKYWVTRSAVCLFACTAHLFACSSLIHSLAHFTHSRAPGTLNDWMAFYSVFFLFWTIVWWKKGGGFGGKGDREFLY